MGIDVVASIFCGGRILEGRLLQFSLFACLSEAEFPATSFLAVSKALRCNAP